jgi:hypothetical protein
MKVRTAIALECDTILSAMGPKYELRHLLPNRFPGHQNTCHAGRQLP